MPAYVVSIRRLTRSLRELKEYARIAPGAPDDPRPNRRLATSSDPFRVLHGNTGAEGMSILEFESFEAASAWFESANYQAALEHLQRGADYEMYLIEGTPESF